MLFLGLFASLSGLAVASPLLGQYSARGSDELITRRAAPAYKTNYIDMPVCQLYNAIFQNDAGPDCGALD